MTTRRDAFKLAAAAFAASGAGASSPAAAQGAGVTPFAADEPLSGLSVELDPDTKEVLFDMVWARCEPAFADYKAAYSAVVALDPGHYDRFNHPVNLADEAAVGLYITGVDEALRLGLLLGMAEGVRLIAAGACAMRVDAV